MAHAMHRPLFPSSSLLHGLQSFDVRPERIAEHVAVRLCGGALPAEFLPLNGRSGLTTGREEKNNRDYSHFGLSGKNVKGSDYRFRRSVC